MNGAPLKLKVDTGGIPAEPDDYRLDEYHAVVPKTLKGARVITTDEAADIWKAKSAAFIDVMPQAPKPADLPEGTIWRDKPRRDVPGSLWLPDVGYGALAPEMDTYFRDGLAKATGGDLSKPVVIYCKANCWQSWNAGKRAMEYGYKNIIWFRDGTDGWEAAGLELAVTKSVPRPGEGL